MLGIGSVSLVAGWKIIPGAALMLCLPIFILPVILLLLTFKTDIFGRMIKWRIFYRFGKFRDFVEKTYVSVREYKNMKGELLPVMLISLFYHFLLVMNNYVLSIALGLDIPIHYFFVFIPVAEILVFLPVTLQGFGVREGTYVALFSSVNLESAKSFALGFSDQIVKLIGNAIGGFVYLFHTLRN